MSRTLGCVLFLLAFTSVVYAARSNICLATTGVSSPTFYKPLQLYPANCPNNASNCMAAVYKYSASEFKSKGPATLMPREREALVYMTQAENDDLDVVVISATSYKNNIIKTKVEIDGAAPGSTTLIKDDPTEDTWTWNSLTNRGNFTWLLQPKFTDGVVLGHFKFVDNYCFRVEFKPNWNGALSTVAMLTGTVAAPVRVTSQPLSTSSTFFEFCQYPKTLITKTDASCASLGSATVVSVGSLPVSAYYWTKDDVSIATTSAVSGLQPGDYVATITVNGCNSSRPVTIGISGVPIAATWTVTNPTKTQPGKIILAISGGNPPYAITWKNAAGTVIASNSSTVNVPAGTFTVIVTDGCSLQQYVISTDAPPSCAAGTFINDAGDCELCHPGTYSNTVDADSCTVCAPGTRNNKTGAINCDECGANTYSGGATDVCSPCPTSTTSSIASGICISCPVGYQRSSGSTTCTACPAGSYRCDENTVCMSCAEGTFSNSGSGSCEACDPGTFTDQIASTSCTDCPAGKYAASGATTCTVCPTGTTSVARSSVLLACM